MKKIIMLLITCLVLTNVQARSRHRGYGYRAPVRTYRSCYRPSYHLSYYRSSSIDRNLNRLSLGVGIAADVIDVYNAARGRTSVVYGTTPVVVQQPQVIYQSTPVYQSPTPVTYQAPPTVIYQSPQQPIIIQTPKLILQSGAVIE